MDTIQAFAMGEAHRYDPMRVFDWDKAAETIKKLRPSVAAAGLQGDWEYTGGEIFRDGKINRKSYTYLASTWAIPELCIDGVFIECWRWMDETKWNEYTKWPKSAVKILEMED
jgi:hypothetical protein